MGYLTLTTPLSKKIFFGRVGRVMVNQCTKYEVSRFTRCEAMNGGAKCTNWGSWGRLWGTQGHGQCHHSIERIRLPIRLQQKPCVYLVPFSRYSHYLSKVADFDHRTCIRRPRRGWPRSNFAEMFGIRKLDSLGYREVLFVWSYVLPF